MVAGKVEVAVPEGMTAEKLLDIVQNYEKRQESNKAAREARNGAIKRLIAAHQAEYDGYLKDAKK